MKFISVLVFAIFCVCSAQAQRGGFGGNRRGPRPIQDAGPKADCPTFCPLNYQPTCGFNGRCYKEFSNTCALNVAACNGEGNFRQVNLQECQKRGARIC